MLAGMVKVDEVMSSKVIEHPASIVNLPTSEEDIVQAEYHKQIANALFAKGDYSGAILAYTDAIASNPNVSAYYSNRAFAYIKTEMYGAAIRDADAALQIDPKFVKAYYRRAVGNMALGKFKDAVKDFRSVVKVVPTDADARLKLVECEKEFKRREFEKAIASDEPPFNIQEKIGNIEDIIVEPEYNGPSFQSKNMSLEFVNGLMQHFTDQKKLHRKFALSLMLEAKELLASLPSIVDIVVPKESTITICGDIHGQYYDLMHIFKLNGPPSPTNMYLFNGDFVDRGSFSVECILTLLAWKVLYPNSMYLSRGNHETNDMNKVYGFEGECKSKYSDLTFKLFTEIFNAIPLGQVIGDKILVIHGGLFSRDGVTLAELKAIDRFRQPGHEGLMCELLWSDPQHEMGRAPSKRGVGLQFGPDITKEFLDNNGLDVLVRSHEVKQEGFEIMHDGRCVTIFSAPNYCDSVGNDGAFIRVGSDYKMDYVRFKAVAHPDVRPMAYANGLMRGM